MRHSFLSITLIVCISLSAQVSYSPDMFPFILQDIFEELTEQGVEVDFEEIESNLRSIAAHPINLNATSEQELKQLLFLTDEQIDAILLFAYNHPFNNLYDLQLIGQLADYEIRDMLPFVYVGKVDTKQPFYWKEMWHYGKQEVNIRLDARNIENNGHDPFYASVKYSFEYGKRVNFGIVAERDPAEPFYSKGKIYGADFYGGWLQLNDVWRFKRIVVGDYRVSFGQGLVLNTNMNYGGKAAALYQTGFRDEGLKRKSSAQEYNFLRGVGATLNLGNIDITALYSARKVDGRVINGHFSSIQSTGYHRTKSELEGKRGVWQQVIGANATARFSKNNHHVKVGLTASETILGDTLTPRNIYYNGNYFRGKRQFAAGVNYEWRVWRMHVFGEIATAQNTKWGLGNITGVRINPIDQLTISAIYRYYSPYFDNLWASGFGESSKLNDEQGVYVGIDASLSKNWQLSIYGDYFYFTGPKYGIRSSSDGFEVCGTATYRTTKDISMQFNLRYKLKGEQNKYRMSYSLTANKGNWTSKTGLVGNLTYGWGIGEDDRVYDWGIGGAVYEQVEYHWTKVPITLQARIEAFYTPNYDNRIYIYENDVLNAFSIPMLYGIGGRWYINFRYKINEMFTLYLKSSQTIFADEIKDYKPISVATRTEIHSMLRIVF